MSKGTDRALTAVSGLAALALLAAFAAGMREAPAGPEKDAVPQPETPAADSTVDPADAHPRSASAGTEAAPLTDPAQFDGSARVEVLNGAGMEGIARDATGRLRELGHDVVFYGNAERFDYDRSVVVDRGGPPGAARAVADALGIAEVRDEADPELALDASVILGLDWELPPAPPANPGGLRGMLRRLLGRS
ncbi:MAG: LytR C-terminal domain-containing protein [Gemmatimonadota bacterium]